MSGVGKGVTAAAIVIVVVVAVLLLIRPRTDDTARKAEDSAKLLEKFRALPYAMLGEEQADSSASGVKFHDPSRSSPGYNFYASKIDPNAWLMDMAGSTVHEWTTEGPGKVVFAIMLGQGDVVMLHRFLGLRRLDWNSRLLWTKPYKTHHDVVQLADGTFYTLSTKTIRYRGLQVSFPVILHLSAGGDEIGRWSADEHMDEISRVFDRRAFLDTVLDSLLAETDSAALYEHLRKPDDGGRVRMAKERRYGYFHANTIGVLPATPSARADERFKEGNILTCFRNVNQIAVLDAETWEVLWAWGEGELEWPHHPTMLDNGNILIFDNGVEREFSRIIEIDPVTGTIEWEYIADPPGSFYSKTEGGVQRLPNGNTLICESTKGRVFEVTRSGEIVWEWLNPDTRDGLRARVYRMMRFPPEAVEPLLESRTVRR